MIKQSRKNRLPADLYSRNTLYGILIKNILDNRKAHENSQSLNILDVGGYEGKLGWFLPQHTKLTILDRKDPPEKAKTNYVKGDATQMPFNEGEFDLVISSDLLEHLDENDREQAFREMLRVSKRHIILAAPFDSIYNRKAEEFINTQFKENTGQDHPFLIEHIQKGLPELEQLEIVMAEQGLSYLKIGEGNIDNWLLQQLTTGASLNTPLQGAIPENFQTFNEFFNENLTELGNFRSPTYRTILFCDKEKPVNRREILEVIEENNNFHTTTHFLAQKKAFDEMRWILTMKDKEILEKEEKAVEAYQKVSELEDRLENEWESSREKEQKIKLLHSQLTEMQDILGEKEQENQELAGQVANHRQETKQYIDKIDSQAKQIALFDTQVRSQDLLVARLKQELEESQENEQELTSLIVLKEQSIKEKNDLLKQKEQETSNLQISLSEYKHELETVLMSRSWKLVRVYGKIKNTLYTRPKNLIGTAWLVLRKMGPREFLRRLKRKIVRSKSLKGSSSGDYQRFIEVTELSGTNMKKIKEQIANFEYKPLISILVPVYNVEEVWLRKAIKSVQNQYYPKWELCLVDDASTAPHIREVLNELGESDERIKVHYRPKNGGIVKASNTALKMARGAYIALLDNDDEIAPNALYEVLKVLQKSRYDMIFSDEDKLEMDGTRTEPYFKPNFDADLLLSNNYLCHFSVLRRKIVEEVGGFRDGTDGAQDFDLFLRFTDKKRTIHHIPKILYHWRKIPGSTAASVDAKPYAHTAAKKVITDAIRRRGIKGEVQEGLWKGSYRVKRYIDGAPLISIIIPFRDKVDILKTCLDSVFAKTTWQNYEILLVNNASELLETREYIREMENCPRVRMLHYNAPFNFSAINNFAVDRANGEYIVLLNNDTEIIEPQWLENMLEHTQRPEVGAVGCKLLYPNDLVQHAGVVVGVGGAANHAFCRTPKEEHGYFGQLNVVRQYSAVTGACMMFRKSVYEEMDGLDEENLAISFNDVDFCLRLQEKGYRIIYTPFVTLYHHESLSRGYNVSFNEEYFLRRRHQGIFKKGDPYYNPNLSRERLDFSLKVMDKVKEA